MLAEADRAQLAASVVPKSSNNDAAVCNNLNPLMHEIGKPVQRTSRAT
jgi:hypothetical protein